MYPAPNVQKTPDEAEPKTQECPQCHAMMPVHFGYITWCDQCGWNLKPHEADRPCNLFESFYRSLGQRLSRGLFDELSQAGSIQPALTLSKVLAFSIAVIVHGLTVALVILGLVLIVGWCPNPVTAVAGLLCLGVAWLLRPHVSKVPPDLAPRDKFPTLYRVADSIAQTLGLAGVDGIVLNESFNAGFDQAGWRRQKILYLGLLLFSILDDQEKVALLAHELAHGANGDPSRNFFIGTAINSLLTWHRLLYPDRIVSHSGIVGLLMIPVNLAILGLSYIPWLGAYLLAHLLWRDSQRAEYLADYLAAQISGTDATLSTLEKHHLEITISTTTQRVMLNWNGQDLFDELRQQIAAVPLRERERIRRVEQLEYSRLDISHPPTAYRVALLKAHPISEPRITLSPSDVAQLEQELAPAQRDIEKRLLELYRPGFYR